MTIDADAHIIWIDPSLDLESVLVLSPRGVLTSAAYYMNPADRCFGMAMSADIDDGRTRYMGAVRGPMVRFSWCVRELEGRRVAVIHFEPAPLDNTREPFPELRHRRNPRRPMANTKGSSS